MRIEIFAAPSCDACEFVIKLLRENDLSFVKLNIASAASMAAFRSRVPSFQPIPQVLIDGKHIGGYEELRLHLGRSVAG